MRVYRCFHDISTFQGLNGFELEKEEARHLARVRRAAPGDECVVINGKGEEVSAVLLEDGGLRVSGEVRHEPLPSRTLAVAPVMTRTDAFEDTLERCIELGVTAIHPLLSESSVVRLDAKKRAARVGRWRRLAIERLKQCERLHLPRIEEPLELSEFLSTGFSSGYHLVALVERDPDTPPLRNVLRGEETGVCLLTGPEGGWSSSELGLLREKACDAASLGDYILRSETALLAGVATVLAD